MPRYKKQDPQGRHIQARLLADRVSEKFSVLELDELRASGMSDREIIRDALIAHRKKRLKGWTPPQVLDEVTITAGMLDILNALHESVQMLQSLDLTSARQSPNWNEETWQATNDILSASAANFFGQSKSYSDDED